jgi:heme A synthase
MSATPTQEYPGDIFRSKPKDLLPTTLNVLTILTFICSALAFTGAFFAFAIARFSYETALRNQARWDRIPIFLQSLLGSNHVDAARVLLENRTPILLINLVTVLLCFFGALQMRKLKKRGFIMYVLGDLLTILKLFFVSVSPLAGVVYAFSYGIALIFVILYATQLKYMN